MTAVTQYYAEVGVSLDNKSLRATKAYFRTIERQMAQFKRRVEKQQSLAMRVTVDRNALQKSLQMSAMRIANSTTFTIKRFDINASGLNRAINTALNSASSKGIKINAVLSRNSLSGMRQQIRAALEGVIIRPKINPSIVGGGRGIGGFGGGGGASGGYRNPMHNPMMIGGGAGSLMRYGAFALPFIGGVYGLNALNTFASTQAAQKTSLDMVTAMSTTGRTSADHQKFLRGLAGQTGKTTMGMTPIFTQMLAASQGTELESQMPEMFSGIMQYASVMGLGEESIKRAMTGFQQMIGKRTIMAEELKGQVGEHIPTVIPLMAKAMGMDVKTLFKTMEKGELDPMTALPKLAKLMKEMSAPQMAAFQQSLPYKQGIAQVNTEAWMKSFNEAGGISGLTRFWEVWGQIISSSQASAAALGSIFEKAAWQFSRLMLVGPEFMAWWNGETDSRNMWQRLFGDAEGNQVVDSLKNNFKQLNDVMLEIHGTANRLFTSMEFSINNKIIAGLRKLIESFATINKMFFYAYTGQFGKVSETFNAASNRFSQIDRERSAADTAESSMIGEFGADKSKWPQGEYTKRYNQERIGLEVARAEEVLATGNKPTWMSGLSKLNPYSMLPNLIPSAVEGIRGVFQSPSLPTNSISSGPLKSMGAPITYMDNSKTVIQVEGTAIENEQRILKAIKEENSKKGQWLLEKVNKNIPKIPQ